MSKKRQREENEKEKNMDMSDAQKRAREFLPVAPSPADLRKYRDHYFSIAFSSKTKGGRGRKTKIATKTIARKNRKRTKRRYRRI